jgi:hypothetical protein
VPGSCESAKTLIGVGSPRPGVSELWQKSAVRVNSGLAGNNAVIAGRQG